MRTRFYGFEIRMGKGITVAEFLTHVATIQDEIDDDPHPRLIRLSESDGYFRGVLVTIKDQRKFLTMRRRGGSFTISSREIEEGSNLIDLNFFMVNSLTGRGLYQHYHHSCSVTSFGVVLRKLYRPLKEQFVELESDVTSEREAAAKYAGSLRLD